MARITGAAEHKRRLQQLRGQRMIAPVGKAIFEAAQDLVVDAALSITAGATSGANHEPSAPGEPPNADTGGLDRGIEATKTGPLKAESSSNAPYAAAQEFGHEASNLPERPYMRPAAVRTRPKALKRVVDAVNKAIRSTRGKR